MKGNKERSKEGKIRRDWVLCYTSLTRQGIVIAIDNKVG